MSPPHKTTSEIPLYSDLVREILKRIRESHPGLFSEGCMILALADEAAKLPKGSPERAVVYRELIDFQRRALQAVAP
jgi:hypothetical protein